MSGCEIEDERVWKNLRGQDLSAYACGPLKTQGLSTFAWHLKNHGTQHDFSCWINKHPKPFVVACEVFLNAPDFAKVWLIEFLDKNCDSDVHHKVLTNLGYHSKFSHGLSPQAAEVLGHIRCEIIIPSDRLSAFKMLLQGKAFNIIDANWNIFEDAAEQMAPKLLTFAASMGWDIHDKLSTDPEDPLQHFIACCQGGLLQRVQQFSVASTQVEAINHALIKAAMHNENTPDAMEDVIKYLFDTYPNQPWHTIEEALGVIIYTPPSVAQKMVAHFHQHAPDTLKQQSEGLACHAIYDKKPKLLEVFFPYVSPSGYHKLFENALINKRKIALKTLLHKCTENTTGHEGFYKALKEFSPKTQQWANEIYATYQKEVLHSKLQTIRGGKARVPGKKM